MSVLNVVRIIRANRCDVLKPGRNIRKHSEAGLKNAFNPLF